MTLADRVRSGEENEARRDSATRLPATARPVQRSPQRSPRDPRFGTLLSRRRIQPALNISSTGDPAEREAEKVAGAIMSMPDPRRAAPAVQRSSLIAARAAIRPVEGGVDAALEARIRRSASGGSLLSRRARDFLEPRFRADFGGVRIHTDANAAALATRIGARAFTFGRHVFFNEGQYRPDTSEGMELLAHELTHTIQQSEAVQRRVEPEGEAPRVAERTGPEASRLGISDARDHFAGAASAIPGFRLFTVVLGFNPITGAPVPAGAANVLRAIVEILPGGTLITRVLDNYGIFDLAGSWIEAQLRTLGISGAAIRAALDRFLGSLSWSDIFDLGGVWRRAREIFAGPIARLIAFARSLPGELLGLVRTAVLRPLARLAEGTRGYPLLKAVLGQDPVTGEPFPCTAETVIGGLLTLIGQQELWRNIQRANAIPRAWTWFQGAIGGLMGLVRSIPDRFMAALRGLEIMDFVILPRAFAVLARTFGGFLADFAAWALGTVFDLLRIVIEVVKPEVMPYLRRAAGAFNTIVRDPVRFVRTLVRAAIQGFRQFSGNFLAHLRASLVGWLTGAMAGANIYVPRAFSLREILKFALSVLGLTWANIRSRLVRATSETVVVALETGFEIVRALVVDGPAAAWQKILETLGNLREMVIGQVMAFVRSRIVDSAVTRLLSMLTPAGALIQAIIAIHNTVMFFVERLSQIGRVAASFIDAIATIAAGDTAPAANRVERTMAGMLTLVISFLARIAGLGRVGDEVTRIVGGIRAPVDRAFDRVAAWIVEQARRAGQFAAAGAESVLTWRRERRRLRLGDGREHNLSFGGSETRARLLLASVELPVEDHLRAAMADTSLSSGTRERAGNALRFFNDNIAPALAPTSPIPLPAQRILRANLDRFSTMLLGISDTGIALPDAFDPTWEGPTHASLQKLSNRTSRRGQDARTGQPGGWDLITATGLTGRNGNWVRMHMISAAYGGLDDPRNLIPAPTAVNTCASVRGFERQVENILYGRDSAADVRGATRSAAEAQAAGSMFKRLEALQSVIWVDTRTAGTWTEVVNPLTGGPLDSTAVFVRSVTLTAGRHVHRNGDWVKDMTVIAEGHSPVPCPVFTGAYTPNINAVGEPILARLTGIGRYYARHIAAASTPPFADEQDFRTRMQARGGGEALTTAWTEAIDAVVAAARDNRLKWSD